MEVQPIPQLNEYKIEDEILTALKRKKNLIDNKILAKYLMPFKYKEWKREMVLGKEIYVYYKLTYNFEGKAMKHTFRYRKDIGAYLIKFNKYLESKDQPSSNLSIYNFTFDKILLEPQDKSQEIIRKVRHQRKKEKQASSSATNNISDIRNYFPILRDMDCKQSMVPTTAPIMSEVSDSMPSTSSDNKFFSKGIDKDQILVGLMDAKMKEYEMQDIRLEDDKLYSKKIISKFEDLTKKKLQEENITLNQKLFDTKKDYQALEEELKKEKESRKIFEEELINYFNKLIRCILMDPKNC